MSLSVEIPFWVSRLELSGGTRLVRAPLFPEISWLTYSAPAVAEAFTHASMRRWTTPGEVMPWLELTRPLALRADTLSLTLPTPPDSGLPESLTLAFDILIGTSSEDALIGFVPALSVGGRGADEAALRKSLTGAVQLEFARKKRLKTTRGVLSSQWFEICELIQTTATAIFYTPAEVRAALNAKTESWLPEAARRLIPAQKLVFEMETTLTELSRALASPHAPCIVLIGPSGVGKSALIGELARRKTRKTFWQTSAAGLERALTGGSGWQDNLAKLCEELAEEGDWLVLQNLAELFEVGRYVGNSTSMAESLRPRISRGGLRLLTECTPKQIARLESSYPGFLDHFVQIQIAEPAEMIALLRARATVEATRVSVGSGSIETLLRLLRRFSPYSGFPGRAVRFIEATCRAIREQALPGALDTETVYSRFCTETGMPRALIDATVPMPIADIRAHVERWIVGQPEAIEAVVQTLISIRAALTRPRRPIATLLFAGPTGVGKTETAKALAAFMFGSPDRMIRFDMSEFSSPGAALRLSDGPGGEGRLTGAVRRQPFAVLLLDEIEKADGMVFDLLLQVLGEGRLTDGRGRTADFCSSIVIMTSNIGARDAARPPSGFSRGASHLKRLPEIYTEAVQRHFRPEFFNRIDRVVAFAALQPDAIGFVLERELSAMASGAGLRRAKASLVVSSEAREHLIAVGYDPAYGARHLQRALRQHLSAPVSLALNTTDSESPLTVHITAEGGALACRLEEHRLDRRALSEKQRFEEVADRIDSARRTTRFVMAGAVFAELRSSLSILRRRQKRLKRKFWGRTADVARLGRLEQIETDCLEMAAGAAALSLKTDLASLEGGTAPGPLEAELTAHLARAQQIRRTLYEALTHDPKVALVGVYGAIDPARELVDLYQSIAKSLGFGAAVANLWLRTNPERPFPNGDPSYPYLLEPPRDLEKNNVSILVGVELLITGAGAIHAFAGEAGIIVQIDQTEQRMRVEALPLSREEYPKHRATDLHRQSAVKGRPRRTIEGGTITDHSYGAIWPRADLPMDLTAHLTATFHAHILSVVTR